MQRYFIAAADWIDGETVFIRGDDAHHLTRVMRLTINDSVICHHPNGEIAKCQIVNKDSSCVKTKILERLEENTELPLSVTLAQGIPKGDKFDLVLQKATELGANGFIPFQAKRSVARWKEQNYAKKRPRFTKIIKEASEQSHRMRQPLLHPLMSLEEILTESESYDIKLFPYEEEAKQSDHQSLGQVLSQCHRGDKVFVCIGPEGGFSEEEVSGLKQNDFHPVRIGPRILRTETAALYVLASISYHFEEMIRS